MRRGKKIFTLLLSVCLIAGVIQLPQKVQAAPGEMVKGKKAGWEIQYKVLKEGMSSGQERSVQVAKVVKKAVKNEVLPPETIIIPGNEYIYDAWETTRVFAVTSIAADAFTECEGLAGVATVRIEGGVTLEPGALNGLSEQVKFQTTSIDTKRALLEYGIPEERIAYQGIKSNYVVFGDSISAGYALPEFSEYGKDENGLALGDAYPTPGDAFAALLKSGLDTKYGPALLNNFSVSGSTSSQLLAQIERGDYDHALKDADIITITIGSNDLLGPFIDIVKEVIVDSKIADILEKDKITIRDVKAALNKIPVIINTLNTILKDNPKLLKACNDFKGIQQKILDKLTGLAPEAKIYWTTLYNPFYGQTLDLAVLFPTIAGNIQGLQTLPLGDLAKPYIEEMNKAFEISDTRYKSVDLYAAFNNAGLTNVVINGKEEDGTLEINLDPHPNTTGHQIIGEILNNAIAAPESYEPGAPAPDQSGAGEFLTFSLQGAEGTIDQAARTVAVTLPYGTDVTNLAAVFTVSDKAKVYVNDTLQESGTTKNNFAQSVLYTVESEIGTRRQYTVNAAVQAAPKEPVKPQGSGDGGNIKGGQGGTAASRSSVDTGDKAPVLWYLMLTLASAAVMLQCFRKKERRKGKRRG